MLGSKDELAAYAVDSEAHEVFPLLPVAPNRALMEKLAGAVQSMGGGIFVYQGLEAGWEALRGSTSGTRHLILFSDSADSEQPDRYRSLLKEMGSKNTTVSVIALGTRQDPDAKLLEEIAALGGGRIFFTNQPGELPNIFAQETVSVARSAFIEEPVGAEPLPGALELVESNLPFPDQVPAFNLCYLRPEATLAVRARDEDQSPLLAFWQRGAGRVADEPLRGAVQAGEATVSFGPIMGGADEEWQFDPARVRRLRTESAASGGRDLLDFAQAWVAPPKQSVVSFRNGLLIAWILLFLAEIFVTRWFGDCAG